MRKFLKFILIILTTTILLTGCAPYIDQNEFKIIKNLGNGFYMVYHKQTSVIYVFTTDGLYPLYKADGELLTY